MDPPPVDICLQCGHQGFTNAFVYCVKCLKFAVHRYCLDTIPETFDEFVRWICDDCEANDPNQLLVQNPEDVFKKEKRNTTSLVVGEDGGRQEGDNPIDHCVEDVGCTTLQEEYEPAGGRPVSEIIWAGCFKICNKDYGIFDGLVAHLSVNACEKVYKEATSFPPVITLEMLPKSDVWPKSFCTSAGPTDESIALYFFPGNSKSEGNFDYLVEILIEEELAMKTTLANAELLVFTSQELPLQYWRFQGKYYLWGVFRGKQPSIKG